MVFWTFAMIVFFCELSEMVTNQFNHFSDELGQCSWYLLPIGLQRMLKMPRHYSWLRKHDVHTRRFQAGKIDSRILRGKFIVTSPSIFHF